MNNDTQGAILEQLLKLQRRADENNAMLVSIQRRAKMSIIFSTLKWLIIIGLTFGSFVFLQPYLEKVFSAYSSLGDLNSLQQTMQQGSGNGTEVNQAEGLINAFKAYMPANQ